MMSDKSGSVNVFFWTSMDIRNDPKKIQGIFFLFIKLFVRNPGLAEAGRKRRHKDHSISLNFCRESNPVFPVLMDVSGCLN